METSNTLPWQAAAPGREQRIATVGVLLALVVAAFETTVVTTAMPTLTAELDGRGLYAWVFTGFLLASTLGVLLGGRLSDRLGRRSTFVAGMGLFLLGSVLCGFSTSVPMLVAFRVLQGLGAGAVQPTTLTISSDLYTLEERAAIQSVFTGAWGLASVIGPVVGGLLTEHLGWRSVFWVNVPVGLLAVAMLRRAYRDPPRTEQTAVRARRPRPGRPLRDAGSPRPRARRARRPCRPRGAARRGDSWPGPSSVSSDGASTRWSPRRCWATPRCAPGSSAAWSRAVCCTRSAHTCRCG